MDSVKASFQDAVFEDGYMWVFDNLIQAICRIDVDTFEMEIISDYKGKKRFNAQKIFLIQDKFYLVTRESTEILIYDRKKQGEDTAFFLQKSTVNENSTKYVGFFLHKNNIYFFPKYIDNGVVCFETSIKKYSKKNFLQPPLRTKLGDGDLILRCFSFYEEAMWFVLNRAGVYGRYDFIDGSADLYQTDTVSNLLSGICFDGDHVWLTETDSNHVICEGKQIIDVSGEQSYWGLYPTTGGIFIPPYKSDKLIFIEEGTFKVTIKSLPLTIKEKRQVINHPFHDGDDFIYLFPLYSDPLFVLNKKDGEIKRIKIKCKNYIKKCLTDNKIPVREDEDIDINWLLHFLGMSCSLTYGQVRDRNESGKAIWELI